MNCQYYVFCATHMSLASVVGGVEVGMVVLPKLCICRHARGAEVDARPVSWIV